MGAGVTGTEQPARLYAAGLGTALALLGLAGFVANPSFSTGDAIPSGGLGPLEINGWQAAAYLAAGLAGLALAVPAPRAYALLAACGWTALAGFGFFGAHGGEPIASMGDRLLATTPVNVLALSLAALGWAAFAASRARGAPASAGHAPSAPTGGPRKDRGSTDSPSPGPGSIGRPRQSSRPARSGRSGSPGRSRRTIN